MKQSGGRFVAREIAIGFGGWFIVHTLFWAPIYFIGDRLGPNGMGLLTCMCIPLPANILALLWLFLKRRNIVYGVLLAIYVNAIGIIFIGKTIPYLAILGMFPFYFISLL